MEADCIAVPFQHGTLQIIAEQDARNTTKHLERLSVAAQEVLHAGIEAEVQEELPRIAQHHHERHQRPPCTADLDAAKMAPVDLGLFAWQAAQTQIGLGRAARAVLGDEVTEVIGAAAVAAFMHHGKQAAGRQCWELLKCLQDERQVGVDRRRPRRRSGTRQTGLHQHAAHYAVVHVQLRGDGADAPFLDMVVAQDLRLDLGRGYHGALGSVRSYSAPRRRSRRRRNPWRSRGRQARPHQWQCVVARSGGSAGETSPHGTDAVPPASRAEATGAGEP